METAMDGIGKHAAFYHAYLPHDRGVFPMAFAMAAVVALGLILYLVGAVGPTPDPRMADASARGAAALVSRPVTH